MQINYIDDNSSERLPEPESFDNIFANIGERIAAYTHCCHDAAAAEI
jgi:hypothetical protein